MEQLLTNAEENKRRSYIICVRIFFLYVYSRMRYVKYLIESASNVYVTCDQSKGHFYL